MTQDQLDEARIFDAVHTFDEAERLGHAKIGLYCKEIEDRGIWRERTNPETGEKCGSFSEWVRCALPYGYGTAFGAKTDVTELLKDVPADDLAQIATCNFPVMKMLSSTVRKDQGVLKAAKTNHSEGFIEHIRQHHPGQMIEHRKLMKFRPAATAAQIIEETLEMAMAKGASSRDQALEWVCVEARQSWQLETECAEAVRP